jgi:SAM-dependent methyltransferase
VGMIQILSASPTWREPGHDDQPMSDERIRSEIGRHNWFIPVDFGGGIVARSTSWPDAPRNSPHVGITKFEFIVKRNLPDLQGRRFLEIGCNCGVVAIHMVRNGAREVVGIDNDATWPSWRSQAEFVREALEWRCQAKYNVRYIECDARNLPSLDVGRFDAVLALNSLYYLDEPSIARVIRHASMIADSMLIQCNTHDHPKLGPRPHPAFMERMLRENGFPHTHVDAPWDRPRKGVWPQRYIRPVVVGHVP